MLLDGHDARELTLESLRGEIGIVFQDTFLFHASIRANLLYARPDASEQEMIAATRAAYMHNFIASLPDGYSGAPSAVQPRRIKRPTAAIISAVRSSCWSGSAPITHVWAWPSSSPSATLSSAA